MPRYACNFIKSIYRAKQAVEIWGSLLDQSLRIWGFTVSKFEEQIYFFLETIDFITIAIVVDNLAFGSNSNKLRSPLKQNISVQFDIKLFGTLTSFVV